MSTHDRFAVQAQLAYVDDDALVQAAVDDMLRTKTLVGDSKRIALADHKPKLSANQRKLKDKMIESFKSARYQPPEIASFAPQAAGNASALKDITEVCVAEGYLVQIADGIYLHSENEQAMRQMVKNKLQQGKGLMVVLTYVNILATTRKFAVPLCEYPRSHRYHDARRRFTISQGISIQLSVVSKLQLDLIPEGSQTLAGG